MQIWVSSHILLTGAQEWIQALGTAGEPMHPKESGWWQGCPTPCSHSHSFQGYQLYNNLKFKGKILRSCGACAVFYYTPKPPCGVNPGLPQCNHVKICFRLCLLQRQSLPSAWGSATQLPFLRFPEVATWISHLFITTTPFNRSFCFPVLTIMSVSILQQAWGTWPLPVHEGRGWNFLSHSDVACHQVWISCSKSVHVTVL